MLRRILVPLDGSAHAERAVPLAARIAHASGGTVVLLRVVSMTVEFWPSLAPPLPSAAMQTMIEVRRAEATNYLEEVARSNYLTGIETDRKVLSGPVAVTILSVARTSQVGLIVMSSYGCTGSTRWVLGSVAEKVTRHASVPVLVLPDPGPMPVDVEAGIERPWRALVPLDGSPLAEAALVPASQLLAALSAPAQGELHLVLVVKLPSRVATRNGQAHLDGGMRAYLQQEAEAYLHAVVDRLRKNAWADHGPLVTWSIAFDADVADVLLRIAESSEDAEHTGGHDGDCDLIVMTTHGRGGLQDWALGNVTLRVLGATRLPLLIVQPPKSERRPESHGAVMHRREDV